MSTPTLESRLSDALHTYADRVPARPDVARLLAALDQASMVPAPRRSRALASGVAAGLALLAGLGTLAVTRQGDGTTDDPVVQVTATVASTVAPTTALPTTVVVTTVPTTLPPTTAPPPVTVPAAPVQAAPPPATAAAPAQQAATMPRQRAAATTAPRPPATTKAAPPPAAAAVAFSATAAFGTCSDDPPYDVYSGTAAPGSRITISSPFGGGSTTADGAGHWERKVVFAGAPVDQPFSVSVSSPQGSDTFTFTHTG